MAEPTRPREATWAGWLIVVGSAVIVVTAFERIASLTTLEAREGVEEMLSEPPASGLGVTVDEMLEVIRIASMLSGGIAAATGILAVYALRRSKSSRRALAILAPPLFVSGLLAGGVMASLVAACTVWLYMQPNRDWFNGRTPERRPQLNRPPQEPSDPPRQEAERVDLVAPAGAGVQAGGEGTGPRPMSGFGSREEREAAQPPSPGDDPGRRRTGSGRPTEVWTACVTTWVATGLGVLFLGLLLLVMLTIPDQVLAQAREVDPDLTTGQDLTDDEIVSATIVTAAVVIAWLVGTAVAAILAFRRNRVGLLALSVSSGTATVVLGLGALGSPVLLVPAAVAVAVLTLVLRPASLAWFRPDG